MKKEGNLRDEFFSHSPTMERFEKKTHQSCSFLPKHNVRLHEIKGHHEDDVQCICFKQMFALYGFDLCSNL